MEAITTRVAPLESRENASEILAWGPKRASSDEAVPSMVQVLAQTRLRLRAKFGSTVRDRDRGRNRDRRNSRCSATCDRGAGPRSRVPLALTIDHRFWGPTRSGTSYRRWSVGTVVPELRRIHRTGRVRMTASPLITAGHASLASAIHKYVGSSVRARRLAALVQGQPRRRRATRSHRCACRRQSRLVGMHEDRDHARKTRFSSNASRRWPRPRRTTGCASRGAARGTASLRPRLVTLSKRAEHAAVMAIVGELRIPT